VFTATPFNVAACGTNDGRIEINISNPASSLFTYSVTGPSPGVNAIDQPANPLPSAPYIAPNLGAGVYGVTVSDQISGCFTITTASVNDNAFTLDLTQVGTCDPISINVAVASGTPTFPVSYTVTNNSSAQVVDTGNNIAAAPFSTNPIPSNNQTYTVGITDASGCFNTEVITIQQNPEVPITALTEDGCSNPIVLNVSGEPGATWSWTGDGITGSISGTSVQVTPTQQGALIYSLTGTHPSFCQVDTTLTVIVDHLPTPALSKGDECADQVLIAATPNGSYLYRWFVNGSLDPNLGSNQALANHIGQTRQYRVELYNPISGCTSPTSPTLDVTVVGALDVTLATTPACEGDQFTITGTTNQPVTSYVWSFEGSVINGETTATLQDTRAGEYKAVVSISGCTAADSLTILLSPITPGTLTSRAVICNDPANSDPNTNQVVLDPGAGFNSYNWFRNGVSLGVTDPTYTATEDGTYSVDLVNSFGCESSDQTVVDIECVPKITGPNAFRPGGLNSNFFLYTFFIDDAPFEVFIFSRWGELVYQSVDRRFEWNGGYNNNEGKPLPPGTYSYVVRYRSSYRPEDGVQEKRGGVVLLR
jgi:gliding motility-associated-like protein